MYFFSEAFADTATKAPEGVGASIMGFVPLILIFFIFYFLIIRPQQKKIKEHSKMVDALRKGDKVVISGGILGTINKVDPENMYFYVEIASGTEVKVLKSSISEVLNKPEKTEKAEKKSKVTVVEEK